MELIVKAITFHAGFEPKESHQLDKLIGKLCKYLEKRNWSVPFVYSLVGRGGNSYGVLFTRDEIQLLKQINNTYTVLDSSSLAPSLRADDVMSLSIERDGSSLSVLRGTQEILSATDSAITGSIRAKQTLIIPSNSEITEKLKEFVAILLETRTEAFYSERVFTEPEANDAVDNMNSAVALCRAFFHVEKF